jgi:3-deoxy-manno-octulosonate cytidylyltransferase (CMP-KDO synthetase)
MSSAIVIPARGASQRFPGKPMHPVLGIPMLERVWRIAKQVRGAARVLIATEDPRVADFARTFGAEAVLTPEACRNGTERVFAAITAANIREECLINLQGDALLTPPWVLETLISALETNHQSHVVTPAMRLNERQLQEFEAHKRNNQSSGTTVVFDRNTDALYFSKQILPFLRNPGSADIYRHVGLYGYRKEALRLYCSLPPSALELTEGLEQLRFLENGLKVRVVEVDYRGRTHASIDNPDDVSFAENIIRAEGELFTRD